MADIGIAFQAGSLQIRWYGIIIATAVLVAYIVAHYRVKRRGGDPNELSNILLVVVFAGIVGARLVVVAMNFSSFNGNIYEMLAIWHGGIAIHGALGGGLLALYAYTRVRKLSFAWWADILAPSMILGQAIGRWGNYFNQELFGYPTRLPWAIYIDPSRRPLRFAAASYFHPIFFYESILNLIVFFLLLGLSRLQKRSPRNWPEGSVALMYAILYSIVRFSVELFRIEPRVAGGLSAAQLASLVIAIVAGLVLLLLRRRGIAGADD